MNSITQNKRYCPHEITTKIYSVKLYRETKDISFVCRRYKISKASLMRWNKLYDGTRESLLPKSHRPKTPHPNAHTEQELSWIRNYHRRNPNISICELYGKLRTEKGYTRHPGSLYRVFIRLGYRQKIESTKEKSKHNGKYDTPENIGIKWQLDVKYVPEACYSGNDGEKFYQYTIIDEADRERFIYPYKEHSGYSTVDFLKRAIIYFGYAPEIIQTDNGSEFCNTQKTKRIHIFDKFCSELNIHHKTIRPRTPWHNGKVERSHRNDQERFYNHLKFYSYEDLLVQMKRYLKRSNNIPMACSVGKPPCKNIKNLKENRYKQRRDMFCFRSGLRPSLQQNISPTASQLFFYFPSLTSLTNLHNQDNAQKYFGKTALNYLIVFTITPLKFCLNEQPKSPFTHIMQFPIICTQTICGTRLNHQYNYNPLSKLGKFLSAIFKCELFVNTLIEILTNSHFVL